MAPSTTWTFCCSRPSSASFPFTICLTSPDAEAGNHRALTSLLRWAAVRRSEFNGIGSRVASTESASQAFYLTYRHCLVPSLWVLTKSAGPSQGIHSQVLWSTCRTRQFPLSLLRSRVKYMSKPLTVVVSTMVRGLRESDQAGYLCRYGPSQ